MTLTQHLAATGIAATLLLQSHGSEEVLLFAAGSVLIDVDHYFLYAQRTGKLDVRGMFRYFEELQKIEQTIPYVGLCVFHTIDFFVLIGILTIFFPLAGAFLVGTLFHFALDLVDLNRKQVPFIRAYFLIEHAIRRRSTGYPFY